MLQPVIITSVFDICAQGVTMNVNVVRQDREESDKDLLLFARLRRHAKISSSVRVKTQSTIFSRSCPRKAFAKQQNETVFAGALG